MIKKILLSTGFVFAIYTAFIVWAVATLLERKVDPLAIAFVLAQYFLCLAFFLAPIIVAIIARRK